MENLDFAPLAGLHRDVLQLESPPHTAAVIDRQPLHCLGSPNVELGNLRTEREVNLNI
jgi:hypothetical protein